ncbi:MAG TPA: fused MFS/spermidine synthase [Vicinamibacterales bacterium]|nr:fused MFS/spermidine synthase [Vicinamibacterales bacterium]
MPLLFLIAYTCSGLAGLVYEVSWTRLLTLYIGHTTAAASAVVAAFLGGLAIGAAGGGVIAARVRPRQSLLVYVGLELVVALFALLLPFELRALTPLLRWAYADAAPGLLFPVVRFGSCLAMVFLPAAALGATFPMAVRWFADRSDNPARVSGALYAMNTVGAAVGSLLAGFVLIPAIGLSGTTHLGVAASLVAAALVALVAWRDPGGAVRLKPDPTTVTNSTAVTKPVRLKPDPTISKAISKAATISKDPKTSTAAIPIATAAARPGLAIAVLGLSGFASLVHEIAWTRILALVLGPTTYAFAATLAAVVAGVAIGSGAGTWFAGRLRVGAHAGWLACVLAAGAVTIVATSGLAGSYVPRVVAREIAAAPDSFNALLQQGMLLTSTLILPTAICLGAAFPLALGMAGDAAHSPARRFGLVYAGNTVGSVAGTLGAGFVLIPWVGLPTTLAVAAFVLVVASIGVVALADVAPGVRMAGYAGSAVALVSIVVAPPWDRQLLASGVYLYAPFVPKALDLETQLKAGTLLYYKDGAPATVSVKRLTGTITLAVDGKTDASNRSDMLTQKLVAHLPLLLHPAPKQVAIIGLGSGVTLGAALSHPIERAEVVEISPEVVAASRFFDADNHRALDDPRTRLIVGDGRSHLLLSRERYDVIVSEPSNPWIAGVAALFTREFFEGAKARLAPGGLICQWAHTYTISERDLRAIVATFTSVFPGATAWMVNDNDLLMVGSLDPAMPALANIETNWSRGGAAANLAEVGATEPFHVLSLYAGGPDELRTFAQVTAANADILDDNRMRLEFSAPRELHQSSAGANDASLAAIAKADDAPALIREQRQQATASQWRGRGDMLAKSDAYSKAYDDYVRALQLDPTDRLALEAFTRTAVLTNRAADGLSWVRSLTMGKESPASQVAISKLLAAASFRADAIDTARQACAAQPVVPATCEQLASLYADAGDTTQLDPVVQRLKEAAPGAAPTLYYAAASAFLKGDAALALESAQKAIAADGRYSAAYDMAGAAHTKLGQVELAAQAFQTSLRLEPHDSTAYTNLGLLALAAGQRAAALNFFAEALWLRPDDQAARDGLARARQR